MISYNRFKARSRLFLAFNWKDFHRTPEATDLEQQFSASVDCGDRQKAYRATVRNLLKSDCKGLSEKIAAESKSQQASCAKWLKACKSDLDCIRRILHLREQQHRSVISIERCADVHSVNLSGLADSSSVAQSASGASMRLAESKGSVGLGDPTGSKQKSDASAAFSTTTRETKSSILGKRTQHPDEEPEGQSDTKRQRRAAPTSTRSSMDLSADEAPVKDDQQDQHLVSMDVAEQRDLELETANGDNDDGVDDEDDDDVKLRSCVRLLDQDMQELQRICSASNQQMLQVCG